MHPVLGNLVLLAALLPQAPAPEKGKGDSLSAEQQRELSRLLADFGDPKKTPEDLAKIADRVLEMGGPGAERLQRLAAALLASREKEYHKAFYEQAADLCRKNGLVRGREFSSEVMARREAVLGLVRENVTKEELVEKGDPAMAWLRENLPVAPSAVLQSSPALKAKRDFLLEMDSICRRCREAAGRLPEPPAGEGKGSGGKKPAPATGANGGRESPASLEASLGDYEDLAVVMALPMSLEDRKTLLANYELERELQREEALGIRDLNRTRALLGLSILQIDLRLCEAARGHSKDMNEKKFFSHDSPVPGKASPWDRAKLAGTTAGAENIASGARTGAAANAQWFHSPGHFRNMMGSHRRMALGRDGDKWTQMFGG